MKWGRGGIRGLWKEKGHKLESTSWSFTERPAISWGTSYEKANGQGSSQPNTKGEECGGEVNCGRQR